MPSPMPFVPAVTSATLSLMPRSTRAIVITLSPNTGEASSRQMPPHPVGRLLSRPGEGRVSPTRLDPIAIPQLPSGALNLEGPPSTPRPSATVLLVRGKKPWELLLMRRPRGADFAPGAYVFPGGVVHDEDSQWGDEIAVAAVRELFEEVGILLARNGRRFAREADCRRVRALVGAGQSFGSALRSTGLEPALDRLVLLARWVTPAQMRRRYDARFYLARLPA
ncbi:MAG TPA: NUDIX hydrolase, partial [Candidatus Dormibacteraeota bacterium]|nr:NUDIX hydrolase [Candidatus Dormibacteraeota bacterium]